MTGPLAKSSISANLTISSTDGGATSTTISEANMVGPLVESSISGISKRQLGQRARRERERSERTTIQHRFFPYLTESHCHHSQSAISSIHEGATSTTFSGANMAGPPAESSVLAHPTISSTHGGTTSMTLSKENMAGSPPKSSISANSTSSSSYRGATLATISKASITTVQASISDALIRKAEMYQEYMKHILIPVHRDSVIPFTSWQGLARSVKQLYRQPLHYLTNILLKQWDLSRVGSEDEHLPLDTLIHPSKAEALIWITEEVHRRTSSHHHLARLWSSDPMYHAYVDPIFP